MNKQPIQPGDVLEDEEDYKIIQGVKVRKGTIAAVIQNIALLDSVSPEQRNTLLDAIKASAPALVVLGVHRYFACRNEEVETILSNVAKDLEN